jgi:hypothetical protein
MVMTGGWMARSRSSLVHQLIKQIIQTKTKTKTYRRPAEGIVNSIYPPRKVMQLRTRLPTLLQLSLEPVKNMIERQATLPGRSHAPTFWEWCGACVRWCYCWCRCFLELVLLVLFSTQGD